MRTPAEIRDRFYQFMREALFPHGFSFVDADASLVRRRPADVGDKILLPTDVLGDGRVVSCTANLLVQCPAEDAETKASSSGVTRAVLTRNIGFLMPQRHWMEWRIAADAYSDEVPRKLAGAVVQFGLPWLARFIDFESIHAGSKTPMSRQASLVYRFVSRSLRREPA